jgi:hypothetical protein
MIYPHSISSESGSENERAELGTNSEVSLLQIEAHCQEVFATSINVETLLIDPAHPSISNSCFVIASEWAIITLMILISFSDIAGVLIMICLSWSTSIAQSTLRGSSNRTVTVLVFEAPEIIP